MANDSEVTKLINELRKGSYTRLSGGGVFFDFVLDRYDAEKAVNQFLKVNGMAQTADVKSRLGRP